MKTYKFYQDRKIKTWERTNFSVSANSYDEAVTRLEQYRDTEIGGDETAGIVISHNETLFENSNQMTVAENEGFSTMELYNEKGEEISNNAPKDNPAFASSKLLTIESEVAINDSLTSISYVQIINAAVICNTLDELRDGMKMIERSTKANHVFDWGFGASHFWLKQRKGYQSPELFDNRVLIVQF